MQNPPPVGGRAPVYSPQSRKSESPGRTHMAIIEEYGAIAKRLRELRATGASSKSAEQITELEHWRDLARQTAREYVESRRRRSAGRLILPQPTD
jgi:hypothetical protein